MERSVEKLDDSIPEISNSGIWEIEVVRGPNDDWLDDEGYDTFLKAEWKLQARRIVLDLGWMDPL